MAQLDEAPIIDLGKNPIPGGAPCGIDAADDEQYMNALSEVAKIGRIEADEPDWYQLEQDCTSVLRSKSKDAEVAAALGHALFKRYSYAGLAAGLGMLTELVNNFWDGLYPERPRRRKARIETLGDRFTEGLWFRENPPKPNDFDGLDLCVTRAQELDAAIKEKMPDDPAEFRKFIEGLKGLAAQRPKKDEPKPAAAPGGAPAGAPAAGGFAVGEVSDAGGALNAILAAATFLRKANPADPVPYAAVRVIKWAKVGLPTTEAAKYEISPPDANVLEALPHQLNNGLFDHLLNGAESAFRANDPLWLDLQRYTCAAMAGLGPAYESARQTVMALTGGLVRRLGEGLFDLRFKGGTPLCSGETRMWIETEALAGGGGGGGGGASDNGQLAETTAEAKKLAGSGKLKEAVQKLQEGLATTAQRRERFVWRLRMAQLLVDAQRLGLAAPLLEECASEIERFHIQEWEPRLAVDAVQTLYRCRKGMTAAMKDPQPEAMEGVRESFAWLCQLDPLAALAAEPSGK